MKQQSRRGAVAADVFVCIFVLLFVAGFALSAAVDELDTAARVKCASNLRQIGQALLMYANENRQAYPRTIYNAKTADQPTWGSGPEAPGKVDAFEKGTSLAPNDVTGAFFLLLRTEDITASTFTCPATNVEPWDFGGGTNTAQNWMNWPKSMMGKYLSYSYQNPYPTTAARLAGFRMNTSLPADFATVADVNPGSPELSTLTVDAPPEQMSHGNSPNHNQLGQLVLYGDGHVDFQNNPFCGMARDNIYVSGTKGADGNFTIVGSPVSASDSVLLPTADGQKYDRAAAFRHMNQAGTIAVNRVAAQGGNLVNAGIYGQLVNREFSSDGMTLRFVSPAAVDVMYSKTPGQIIARTCITMLPDRLRLTIVDGGTGHVLYFTIVFKPNAEGQIDHLVQQSDGTIFDLVQK